MENIVSKPTSGVKKDIDPRNLKEGDLTMAINATYTDKGTDQYELSYEKSNILYTELGGTYEVIGIAYRLKTDTIYLFQVNDERHGRISYLPYTAYKDLSKDIETCNGIKELDTTTPFGSIQTLIDDECKINPEEGFNFNKEFPIKTPIIKEEKSGGVLYFTDNRGQARKINLDKVEQYFEVEVPCVDSVISNCPDFNKMLLRKENVLPEIEVTKEVEGGSLKDGSYEFLISLTDASGEVFSEFTSITQPTTIYSKSESKGIELNIKSLDTSYTHYKIVCIYRNKIDNSETIIEVGVYPITQSTVFVSNINSNKRVSRQDLNFFTPRVVTSENLAEVSDSLVEYGLKFERELNLQPIANILGSFAKWQTHITTEDFYKDGAGRSNFLGYNRNEVVPIGLRFLRKGGTKTSVFPLVGREAKPSDLTIVPTSNKDRRSFESNDECVENLRSQRWQYYNTATELPNGCGTSSGKYVEVEEIKTESCTVSNVVTIPSNSYVAGESYFLDYVESHGWKDALESMPNDPDNPYADILSKVYNEDCTTTCEVIKKLSSLNFISNTIEEKKLSGHILNINAPIYVNKFKESRNMIAPLIPLVPINFGNIRGKRLYVTDKQGNHVLPSCPADNTAEDLVQYTRTFDSKFTQSTNTDITYTEGSENKKVSIFRDRSAESCSSYIDGNLRRENTFYLLGTQITYPVIKENASAPMVVDVDSRMCIDLDSTPMGNFRGKVSQSHFSYSYPAPVNRDTETGIKGASPTIMKIYTPNAERQDNVTEFPNEVTDNQRFRISFYHVRKASLKPELITAFQVGKYEEITVMLGGFPVPGGYEVNINGTKYNIYDDGYVNGVPLSEVKDFLIVIDSEVLNLRNIKAECADEGFPITGYKFSPASDGYFNIIYKCLESATVLEHGDIEISVLNTYSTKCITQEPIPDMCGISPNSIGEFGYWESVDTYPDNGELYDSSKLEVDYSIIPSKYITEIQNVIGGGSKVKSSFNLRCKPIRHFKFPSNEVSPFMDPNKKTPFSSSYIYPLGITINEEIVNIFLDIALHNNLISKEERDGIYGYEVMRGDLNANRSVISSGLLYDLRDYTEKGRKVSYPNYPYNSFSQDYLNLDSQVPSSFGQKGYKFTYHSPETDYTNTTQGTEINIEGYLFGKSRGHFDEVKKHPKWTILSSKAYSTASTLASLEVAVDIANAVGNAGLGIDSPWFLAGFAAGSNVAGTIIQGVSAAVIIAASTTAGVVYNYGRYKMEWHKIFKDLGQKNNYASYYFSEGDYNEFKNKFTEGEYIRRINVNKRLPSGRFYITDDYTREKEEINNIQREESTYLTVGSQNSITFDSEYSNYDKESLTYLGREGLEEVGRSSSIIKNIASPYAQIVTYNPRQHGNISSINWLYAGYRGNLKSPRVDCLPIFGGDTFITRHTLKRKMPLYLTTAMGQADGTPFNYELYNNIGTKPLFFCNYETNSEFTNSGKSFPEIKSEYKFDNTSTKGFYLRPPSKMYLYYYGIPSFLCETRINTNYRESGKDMWEQFYPEVGDIGEWTQESVVPISTPNFYKYSTVYSNQVSSHNTRTLVESYKRAQQDILENSPNGAIISMPDNDENSTKDPWTKFRPLDFFEFPTKYGKLVELKGIENEAVIARFNDTTILYNKVDQTTDNGQSSSIRLGGKSIFSRRTASFVNSDIGYGGSKQTRSLSCEYGHFSLDTDRGQILHLAPSGTNMVDISERTLDGQPTFMKSWIKRHLPFKLKTSGIQGIEDISEDNNFKGIGTSLGYDSENGRIVITKKDYLPKKDCIRYEKGVGFLPTTPDCGTTETEFYCDTGWTFNKETNLCEKIQITEACPEGYIYDSNEKACKEFPCTARNREIYIGTQADATGRYLSEEAFDSRYSKMSGDINSGRYKIDVIKVNNEHIVTTGSNITDYNILKDAVYKIIPWDTDGSQKVKLAQAVCMAIKTLNQETEDYKEVRLVVATNSEESGDSVCDLTTDIYDIKEIISKCKYDVKVTVLTSQYWNIKSYLPYGEYQGAFDPNYATRLFLSEGDGAEDYRDGTKYSAYGNVWGPGGPVVTNLGNSTKDILRPICTETYPPYCSEPINDKCETVLTKLPGVRQKAIELDNPEFFEDVSWTITYQPQSGAFGLFMDYKPNYYITTKNGWFSGLKNSIWAHSVTNKSFGVFYGKKYPMIVEVISKAKMGNYLGSVSLLTESKRFQNNLDFYLEQGNTFNKTTIYNRSVCSGVLDLEYINNSKLASRYPKQKVNGQVIPIVFDGSFYNYNYFYNRVNKDNIPFLRNDINEINKEFTNLVYKGKTPLRRLEGDYFITRLIKDNNHNNQLTFKAQKSLTNFVLS